MIDTLRYELRHALRSLVRWRSFTIVAVVTLGLGIGANVAVFSVVNATLLSPPHGTDRLLRAAWFERSRPGHSIGLSYPEFMDLAARKDLFEGVLAFQGFRQPLTAPGEPSVVRGALVSGNYFEVLGITLIRGRLPRQLDFQQPGSDVIAVISEHLWRSRFGSRDDAVGATIRVANQTLVVVGVAPAAFGGLMMPQLVREDIWLPLTLHRHIDQDPAMVEVIPGSAAARTRGFFTDRTLKILEVRAKPRRDASVAQVRAATAVLAASFLAADPPAADQPADFDIRSVDPLPAEVSRGVLPTVFAVSALAFIILGIACANLAALLLSRTVTRAPDLMLRQTLGASRRRLVGQLMTENVVLALMAAVAALWLVIPTNSLLSALRSPGIGGLAISIQPRVDATVVAYVLGLAVLATIMFGLAPSITISRLPPFSYLGGYAVVTAGRARLASIRNILLIGQFAACTLLLILAGQFLSVVASTDRRTASIRSSGVGVVDIDLTLHRLDEDAGRSFVNKVLHAGGGSAAGSNIQGIAVATQLPSVASSRRTLVLQGDMRAERTAIVTAVSPDSLEMQGIRVVAGRDLSFADSDQAARVALVSEAAAAALWPGEIALGKSFSFANNVTHEIVGVVSNARPGLHQDSSEAVYLPFGQSYSPRFLFLAKGPHDGQIVAEALRRVVRSVDPQIVILESVSLRQYLQRFSYPHRLFASLVGGLGGLALVLSCVGLYGVTSYIVSQQLREFGIRMSLGATARQIAWLVLSQALKIVAVAAPAGILGALAAQRVIETFAAGVIGQATMPYLIGPVILGLIAVLACYIPVRRATMVDPSQSLRAL